MNTESTYKWHIQRAWTWTTKPHCTEEEVKAEHPEAIRLPGTLLERVREPALIEPTRRPNGGVPLPPRDFMAECDPKDIPF
ncbi:hypothetical protein [Comamonas sp. B21-038]|uniref:hypothetical protein n=1 Tax=Comamonas sp. B21-038 TaxID=2918299 RepID=UPI001EFBB159|nr:hypothetical protein [Comamonas sp. B21-038]ULR90347.1 hypothetical protein MJ205_05610 [Comamonas sp. B21-038]